ncbi:MAG: hypothetical protein EPO22_12995 [Dehalococcoidia bacterium]|nr:MAG: hypothetical protein EPO22_12995 [Dehalococcoidia bacterium]
MSDGALESLCRDCGGPVSFHPGASTPARCPSCFDGFMRTRDAAFLSSYAELGVASRRIMAETCLRALVTAPPPHRKVLAMNIMEQYVLAASDLIGLYEAVKQRGGDPVMKHFLSYRIDRASALAFFHEMATTPGPEMLSRLGLPGVDGIAHRCPSLSKSDVKDLRKALVQMLGDLKRTGDMGETAALALAQMAGESRAGAALVKQSTWLDNIGLRPNQVAAIAIDERRRTVNVTAFSVDEKRLQSIVSVVDAMTNAARNLIYGVLTMYQEDDRARAATPSPSPSARARRA